jgi:hypothetical protein
MSFLQSLFSFQGAIWSLAIGSWLFAANFAASTINHTPSAFSGVTASH